MWDKLGKKALNQIEDGILGKAARVPGAGKGIVYLYHELRGGQKSYQNDLTKRIQECVMVDHELGIQGKIVDVARKYGLETDLREYLKKEMFSGKKRVVAQALDVTTSLKDGLEDFVEGLELVGTTTAGIATAGPGIIAFQLGASAVQIPLYLITQTVYTAVAGALGFAAGVYTPDWKGVRAYAFDSTKGYAGAWGSALPFIGSLIEIGANFDDKRPRIAESGSREVVEWLREKIKASKDNTKKLSRDE